MFVVYHKETTKFLRVLRNGSWWDAKYETQAAAAGAITRQAKKDPEFDPTEYDVAEMTKFYREIEKKEIVYSLMDKDKKNPIEQGVNTPLACDPSSETYWSM